MHNTNPALSAFDNALAEGLGSYLSARSLNPAGYTAEIVGAAFSEAFRQGYLLGIGQVYLHNNVTRLEVSATALQGLLASGYFPEHGDLPKEAVHIADRLIKTLTETDPTATDTDCDILPKQPIKVRQEC